MGTIDTSLQRIYSQLHAGNAGLAIMELDTYLMAWPNPQSREKLETLKSEYDLMADYWIQGVTDPERDEQYRRLLQRIYVAYTEGEECRTLQGSPTADEPVVQLLADVECLDGRYGPPH